MESFTQKSQKNLTQFEATIWAKHNTQHLAIKQARKPRATLVWNSAHLITDWLTLILARVKCRATSVAKKHPVCCYIVSENIKTLSLTAWKEHWAGSACVSRSWAGPSRRRLVLSQTPSSQQSPPRHKTMPSLTRSGKKYIEVHQKQTGNIQTIKVI